MPGRCLSFSTGLIKYEHAIYVYDTQHCGQRMSAQARPRLITLNTSNKTKYLFPSMHAAITRRTAANIPRICTFFNVVFLLVIKILSRNLPVLCFYRP